jgi:hypothetical protein
MLGHVALKGDCKFIGIRDIPVPACLMSHSQTHAGILVEPQILKYWRAIHLSSVSLVYLTQNVNLC